MSNAFFDSLSLFITILILIFRGADFASNLRPSLVFAKSILSIDNKRDVTTQEDISRVADIISEFVRLRSEFRRFDIGSQGSI
jgi:hypothetical protein